MSQPMLDPWGPLKVFGIGFALFGKAIPILAVALVLAWVFFFPHGHSNDVHDRARDTFYQQQSAAYCADQAAHGEDISTDSECN